MTLPTAADIALGTRAQQIEKVENAIIRARYPNSARDDFTNPPQGYFDLAIDAQTILAGRAALQGSELSRFSVTFDALIWFDPVAYFGVRFVDPAARPPIDKYCLVARYQIDCEAERTTFELLG